MGAYTNTPITNVQRVTLPPPCRQGTKVQICLQGNHIPIWETTFETIPRRGEKVNYRGWREVLSVIHGSSGTERTVTLILSEQSSDPHEVTAS